MACCPVVEFSKTRPESSPFLKRPAPTMCQPDNIGKEVVPETAPLFINQMAFSPVLVFSQNRSALPSPLKSPTATMSHPTGMAGKYVVPETAPLFINQMACSPVVGFSQSRSALPSPLKSLAMAWLGWGITTNEPL